MAKAPENTADKGEIAPDIAKMSFEEALGVLEDIVDRLESGNVNLDESIDIYTRGMQLRQHCEAKLSDAQARIEKIVKGPGGELGSAPADVD
jgi:exodeoxyribonuclease VII small subunit